MKARGLLLLGIPLLVILLLTGIFVALPAFVSSATHRATIEALASALTGRQVHIGGKLSLAILPAPQFIAERITINGPAAETITARSLTLDIAVPDLLRGRLTASSLTLQSPTINIPWPLPGNGTAANRPPWLAALHAQINNGRISIGAVDFTHVTADVFTGTGGALSLSGSFTWGRRILDLSFSLGAADGSGSAPVTLDAKADDASNFNAHLSGTLSKADELTAGLTASATMPGATQAITGTAAIAADGNAITASDMRLRQGGASLTGTTRLAFSPAAITATLAGQNLDLAQLASYWQPASGLPAKLDLAATDSTLAGATIPQLRMQAELGADGSILLPKVNIGLPGNTVMNGAGMVDQSGQLAGQLSLTSADLPTLFTGPGNAARPPSGWLPSNWKQAHLGMAVRGDRSHLTISQLSGTLGPSRLTGGVILTRAGGHVTANGQVHFDTIAFTAPIDLSNAASLPSDISIAGEITADRAVLDNVPVQHLLLDATLDNQLTVRRISASLYGGLAASSAKFSSGGMISARGLLSLPSATPLFAALPARWRLPHSLAQAPLAVSLVAQGPTDALVTSGTASLGTVSITAAPVVDPSHLVAAGALTLRYPSAIAGLAAFGLPAGQGWPGAGSISLRADAAVSPTQFNLRDFVLSLGELTANGAFSITTDHQFSGDIDADTLALPTVPTAFAIPWPQLTAAKGTIKLAANQVLLNGQEILGPSALSVTLVPNLITLAIPHATVASGTLTATLTAVTAANAAPQLNAKLNLSGANSAFINLPLPFPITLPSGTIAAQAALTASGYTQAVWAATLAGTATASASNGILNGFSLTGLAQALKLPNRAAALTTAARSGTTNYTAIAVTGNFDHGNYNLGTTLRSPSGSVTANGSIDIPDKAVALKLALMPNVSPNLTINLSTIGSWATPKQIPAIAGGLAWKPSPNSIP